MDVVNLIYNIKDEFGILMSSTWGGGIYQRVLDSGEVLFAYFNKSYK